MARKRDKVGREEKRATKRREARHEDKILTPRSDVPPHGTETQGLLDDGRSLGSSICVSLQIKDTDLAMARKAGQGKEEEEFRARQQEEKTPVRDEEKKPAAMEEVTM
ncbi:hypothetical protein STEG23_015146 [Scotinomys teguina]